MDLSIFHAYDIRGTYPNQINEAAAERIAQAYAAFVKPKTVAVGSDVRLSSPSLKEAVTRGLISAGVNVIDVGVGPTEQIYFAVGSLNLDGGIQVTASHNPAQYNGMKMVREKVEAISNDTGLEEIKQLALGDQSLTTKQIGQVTKRIILDEYVDFLANRFKLDKLRPLKIVANNNFGMSGPVVQAVLKRLSAPVELVELNFKPDGSFPKGRPDPLIPENQQEVTSLILQSHADMGASWDADGDRCYIADENGQFIDGSQLTAILARHLLTKHPGEKIIYTPQNIWAAQQTIIAYGGIPVMCRHGHSILKNRMRSENALFAGEKSGHYYYRDFYYADSGVISFLTFLELLAQTTQKVSEIAEVLRDKYFVSQEYNFTVDDINKTIDDVRGRFPEADLDTTDGVSLTFKGWRFNIYGSQTEPLLRLNVEATSQNLLAEGVAKVTAIISPHVVKS